ncbi:protein fem-1 homolog C-like [Argopecten irradians]|uniref:protein fem-1 homolog C-like n=1 Tax=Argopecten irradians TaxID=31199 RepID=UPI0037228530
MATGEQSSLNTIAYKVHSFIENGDLIGLRQLLEDKTLEERQAIVNENVENSTALVHACFCGRISIVNYLLTSCRPDIEATGKHKIEETDDTERVVPPLWIAAISNKLDIAKALIENGADVNGCSNNKSTAVLAACYSDHVDMVKYLVKHGADINLPKENGTTCLMNSIESTELCEFLMQAGADVNAQEADKLTALHCAVEYANLDTIKVLLQHGTDVNLKNVEGLSPLLLAAIYSLSDITYFFINQDDLPIPTVDKINAIEMLGAKAIDYQAFDEGKELWAEGIRRRDIHGIPKQLPDFGDRYDDAKEAETLGELTILPFTPTDMYLHAALVKERILGPHNRESILGAIIFGRRLKESRRFQKALKLYSWCYDTFIAKEWYLVDNCIFSISQVLNLTVIILKDDKDSGRNEQSVNMYSLLHKLTEHTLKASPQLEDKIPHEHDMRNYYQLLLLLLDCIALLIHMASEESDIEQLIWELRRILKFDPRAQQRRTLLHLAVDKVESKRLYGSKEMKTIIDYTALVRFLLECGAKINSVDAGGNSPLHCHIKAIGRRGVMHETEILNLLLEHGAHVDMVNKAGETPLSIARRSYVTIHEVRYIKLQCLAANIINKFNISFRQELPSDLISFVEIHGARSHTS